MITLACIGHAFRYELEHITRLFYPGEKIHVVDSMPEENCGPFVITEMRRGLEGYTPYIQVKILTGSERQWQKQGGLFSTLDNEAERWLAVELYRILQKIIGTTPPWGILTGVRPVRLYRQWLESGLTKQQAIQRFECDYLAQSQKIGMAVRTAEVQQPILEKNTPDSYSLYISIPFCPTRCVYCSFVSHAIEKSAKLVPEYIRLLCEELKQTAEIARSLGLRLHTIYMGGGTPTSLSAQELEQILSTIETYFDRSTLMEYTVEAGRADTITVEKLDVLRKFGVGRISINPQTMDDGILKQIGRAHTAQQVVESFSIAREKGFSAINMDLIAGLPGETPDTFARTLEQVVALGPENITLHTLTVKRSSHLREQENAFAGSPYALDKMLFTAQNKFEQSSYHPYYLYRQKGTVQNLENTGFSLPGYEGVYNVYSMEEVHTILAVGAGGVTKLCQGNEIERIFNLKYPYEYIRRFQELMERKTSVEAFYERHIGKKVYPR